MLTLLADPHIWLAFLTLTAMEIVLGIDNVVFLSVLSFLPFVNCVVPVVGAGLMLGLLVLHVLAIVKAINGERLRIPALSDIADKI